MINIEPSGVTREWLAQLKDMNGDSLKYAPKEWINFIENGLEKLTPLIIQNKGTFEDSSDLTLPSEKQYLRKIRTTQGKF
ncbi:hypothetical protein [Bacillus cereus]|uniref:hypothetical protein n=1 Tax=Bacillus cereus TaxID=1396 RepID=UPI0010BE8919|nr:hypothetical protein [Bacillus cereus]TKH85954.1 hypothetical protein FC685_24690 [Bacillus cereus]